MLHRTRYIMYNHEDILDLLYEKNWLEIIRLVEDSTMNVIESFSQCEEKSLLSAVVENCYEPKDEEAFSQEELDQVGQLIALIFQRFDSMSCCDPYSFDSNCLHIIAHGEYPIEILKILLQHASSQDVNCYNAFGKTPLHEALEKGYKEAAIELLAHPEIDPNLFKIDYKGKYGYYVNGINYYKLGGHQQKIKSGTSSYQAAQDLGQEEVAEFIRNHPKYNAEAYYSALTSDILYRNFDHYAACGNADTLKSVLKIVDIKDFLAPDKVGWTVLHIACFAGNIDVVQFLLNKEALEKACGKKISDRNFENFVNYRSDTQTPALGRALFCSDETKIHEQIRLFIHCPHFLPNKTLAFADEPLLHTLLRNGEKNLMLELAKRRDFDINLRDGAKNTALRIACEDNNLEMVKLLAGIGEMTGIDINELNKGEAAVMKHLRVYSEENWFCLVPSHITLADDNEELTVNDLYNLYENGEPLSVRIRYKKYFNPSTINSIDTLSEEENNKIKRHLLFALEEELFDDQIESYPDLNPSESDIINSLSGANTERELLLNLKREQFNAHILSNPCQLRPNLEWIDKDLAHKISTALKNNKQNLEWSDDGEINEITLEDYKLNFTLFSKVFDEVEEDVIIDVDYLNQFIPKEFNRDVPEKFEAGKFKESTALLDMIATEYISAREDGDTKKASDLLEIFKVLVFSPKSKSAISNIGINKIVENAPALKAILEESKTRKSTLENFSRSNETIDEFSAIWINRVFLANLSRKFIPRKNELINRRFDALSRIIFGGSRCSAASFDGESILLSTNLTSSDIQDLVEKTMDYFAKVASKTATIEDKISLVSQSSKNLILNESGKSGVELDKALQTLIDLVYENLSSINLTTENLKENGVIDDDSFDTIKRITGFASAITALENLNFNEGYIRNAIKYSFRGFRDVSKIEQSMVASDASSENKEFDPKIFKAFKDKNYLYLNKTHPQEEGVHAEMRVADYLLMHKDIGDEKFYIGLPKLCCAECNFILSKLDNFSIESETYTRGQHTEIYSWPTPNFLKEKFNEIFSDDKALLDAFKKAKNPHLLIENCFKTKSMQTSILSGHYGRPNQDLDLSTSVPTFRENFLEDRDLIALHYVLSEEMKKKLLPILDNKYAIEKAAKEAEKKKIKDILYDRTIKKDALREMPPKFQTTNF